MLSCSFAKVVEQFEIHGYFVIALDRLCTAMASRGP